MLSKSAELKFRIFCEMRALWLLQNLQLSEVLPVGISYSLAALYSD